MSAPETPTPVYRTRARDGAPKTPVKTPDRPGSAGTPKTPRTALKVQYQETLLKFQGISDFVDSAPEPDQQAEIILAIRTYAAKLCSRYGVVPDEGGGGDAAAGTADGEELELGGDNIEERPARNRGRRRGKASSGASDDGDDGDDGDSESVQEIEARTKSASRRRVAGSIVLQPIQLNLTAEVTTTDLEGHRADFLDEMRQLVYSIRRFNKPIRGQFTDLERIDIANFFFHELMGPNALNRLTTLVQYYATVDPDTGLTRGIGARADAAAQNRQAPVSIRRFFRAFGNTVDGRISRATLLSSLHQTVQAIRLAKFYNTMRAEIRQPDGQLRAWLTENEYGPQGNGNWAAALVRYISDTLNTEKPQWHNIIQHAIGVRSLQRVFGNGILVLLPTNAMYRLNRFGNRRMAYVYPMLQQHIACFQPVCDLLERHVYNPIMAGLRITFTKIDNRHAGSLLEKIAFAVVPDGDEQMPDVGLDGTGGEDGEVAESGDDSNSSDDSDSDYQGNTDDGDNKDSNLEDSINDDDDDNDNLEDVHDDDDLEIRDDGEGDEEP